MSRRPSHVRAARLAVAALALAALAAAAASCGRAPLTAPPAVSRPASAPAASGPGPGAATLDYWDELAVLLVPGTDAAGVAGDYGATLLDGSTLECARIAPAPGESCDTLAARMAGDPRILSAERDGDVETTESRQESYATDDGNGTVSAYVEQPAAAALGLPAAHLVSRGQGVIVAVLDTGIDPQHPALRGRLVPGRDFVDLDADPTDVPSTVDSDGDGRLNEAYGHGTHVAGIVALTAPGARIMPVRVLDANGRGSLSGVAAGLRWAVSHGARVVNMSLGALRRTDVLQHLLDEAELLGVVVVASAGNWGADSPVEFPAASSHAHAVAAAHVGAQPAPFTSYGSFVAISAPGVGIRSAYPGGGYRLWDGTSMSAPFVAGGAALLLALHPQWHGDQVMQRLGSTARPLTGVAPGQQDKLGEGMLDLAAALAGEAPAPGSDLPVDHGPGEVLHPR